MQNPAQTIPHLAIMAVILSLALTQVPLQVEVPKPEPITLDNLANELIANNIEHWDVVMAQAILEAGWEFSSPLFHKTNNFVGMRVPNGRPSMRIGAFRQYSVYGTWKDCVQDIKLWQDQNWHGGSQGQYIHMMHRIWAQSPDYQRQLSIITRKMNHRYSKLIVQVNVLKSALQVNLLLYT